jgi:ABC-type bacteriocin/lantibiotic exporter with double-glycine peptidase domain
VDGQLITGLYRPASDTVSWDGIDLSEVDDDSVRRRFGDDRTAPSP